MPCPANAKRTRSPGLEFGDEGIHLRHDLRPRRVSVEQDDRLNAVLTERRGNVLGVRPRALQLPFWI